MTTRLRWPALSPPKPIAMQSFLFKITTCLMQPATIFTDPKMKKEPA